MPFRGGATEKYGDEENETESRRGIQGPGSGVKSDKALLELADPFGVHPIQITEWSRKPHVQRYETQAGRARYLGSPRQDRATNPEA